MAGEGDEGLPGAVERHCVVLWEAVCFSELLEADYRGMWKLGDIWLGGPQPTAQWDQSQLWP